MFKIFIVMFFCMKSCIRKWLNRHNFDVLSFRLLVPPSFFAACRVVISFGSLIVSDVGKQFFRLSSGPTIGIIMSYFKQSGM